MLLESLHPGDFDPRIVFRIGAQGTRGTVADGQVLQLTFAALVVQLAPHLPGVALRELWTAARC